MHTWCMHAIHHAWQCRITASSQRDGRLPANQSFMQCVQDLKHPTRTREDSSFQPAAQFRPLINDVYNELCEKMASIPGSSVEHNTFCVSAHFRNCPSDSWQKVVEAVEGTLAGRGDDLKITRGRKVMEIRPKVWRRMGTGTDSLGCVGWRWDGLMRGV